MKHLETLGIILKQDLFLINLFMATVRPDVLNIKVAHATLQYFFFNNIVKLGAELTYYKSYLDV